MLAVKNHIAHPACIFHKAATCGSNAKRMSYLLKPSALRVSTLFPQKKKRRKNLWSTSSLTKATCLKYLDFLARFWFSSTFASCQNVISMTNLFSPMIIFKLYRWLLPLGYFMKAHSVFSSICGFLGFGVKLGRKFLSFFLDSLFCEILSVLTILEATTLLNCPSSKGNHTPRQKFERPNGKNTKSNFF